MSPTTTARWTLIAGVAFVFLYFGVDKFVSPLVWIGWLPGWMDGLGGLEKNMWLQIIAVIEIVIGVGILIPVRIVQKIAVLLATVHLAGILTQIGWNDIAVRDVGLMCMTIALWYLISARPTSERM